METKTKKDAFQIVNDQIIESLKKGIIPWKINWEKYQIPENLISGKPYRAANIFLLLMKGYKEKFFITFNEIKKLKAKLKAQQKSNPFIYWKFFEGAENKPELRSYSTYNIEQVEGLPEELIPKEEIQSIDPDKFIEEIINKMEKKPQISLQGDKSAYMIKSDQICIMSADLLLNQEEYYHSIFKNLIHSTGHQDRLNRKELIEQQDAEDSPFTSEILIAEIGASILMAHVEMDNSTEVGDEDECDGWIAKFTNYEKTFVYACIAAQKAVDFLLHGTEEKPEE